MATLGPQVTPSRWRNGTAVRSNRFIAVVHSGARP
jgi:hypothetical protein